LLRETRHILKAKDFITGIDLGSSKTRVVIGRYQENQIDILGYGEHPSTGVKNGHIVNLVNQAKCIEKAVRQAEKQAGEEVSSAYVGISGSYINTLTKRGKIPLDSPAEEIKVADVRKTLSLAKSEPSSLGREILHAFPSQFTLDETSGIKNPLGLYGKDLGVEVATVIILTTAMQNTEKCVNRAGLDIDASAFNPLVSGNIILHPEEKELGSGVLDLGGGLIDIAIFRGETPVYAGVLTIGGQNLSRDIASHFHISLSEAERIKKEEGCALRYLVEEDQEIKVFNRPEGRDKSTPQQQKKTIQKTISKIELAEIIEKRMELVLTEVHKRIKKYLPDLGAGLVLTGGSSQLAGIKEMSQELMEIPIRTAQLSNIVQGSLGLPSHSVCLGLIKWGQKMRNWEKDHPWEKKNPYEKTLGKVIKWVKDFF